jgi:hypothetical protein
MRISMGCISVVAGSGNPIENAFAKLNASCAKPRL